MKIIKNVAILTLIFLLFGCAENRADEYRYGNYNFLGLVASYIPLVNDARKLIRIAGVDEEIRNREDECVISFMDQASILRKQGQRAPHPDTVIEYCTCVVKSGDKTLCTTRANSKVQ